MYTGDLGVWDEHEFVTVVGRKDDMIVSAGENIYPTQIEAILNEHPKVRESAVIGIPDRMRGQIVAAYVIPEEDAQLTSAELKEYCANHPHAFSLQASPAVPHRHRAAPHRYR